MKRLNYWNLVHKTVFRWYFGQCFYYWKIILCWLLEWTDQNSSNWSEQKYWEITFPGKLYSLLVTVVKMGLMKTGLLVTLNKMLECQGLINIYCTTPMLQDCTMHCRGSKSMIPSPWPKGVFYITEMKKCK